VQISDLAREGARGFLGIRLVMPPTIYIGGKNRTTHRWLGALDSTNRAAS